MGSQRKINWQQVRGQLERNQLELERAFSPDPRWVEKVFRRRAELFASRGSVSSDVSSTPTLVFLLGRTAHAVDLRQLEGIYPLAEWAPVPGAGPELLGVASLRGEPHSVLELGHLLRVEQDPPCAKDYVLLAKFGSNSVGVRVSQIERVHGIDMQSLTPLPQNSTGQHGTGIRGLAADGVVVIDMECVLREVFRENGGPCSESQQGSLI